MSDAVQWLERARHDDLVADIVARVRRETPGLSDDLVAQIEAEIRRDWGGVVVRVRRSSAIGSPTASTAGGGGSMSGTCARTSAIVGLKKP